MAVIAVQRFFVFWSYLPNTARDASHSGALRSIGKSMPWTRDAIGLAPLGLPSHYQHVVLDRLHASYAACDTDCLIYCGLRRNDAAQLDHTHKSFHVNGKS
jgi:hypothetical protein